MIFVGNDKNLDNVNYERYVVIVVSFIVVGCYNCKIFEFNLMRKSGRMLSCECYNIYFNLVEMG